MHSVCSGIAEKFCNYWFGPNGPLSGQIKATDKIMKKITVPTQIQRLIREINERNWWKAREWEN